MIGRLILGMVLVLGACRSPAGRANPQECAPVTAALPATVSTEGLAGTYTLKLIATSGAKQGGTAEGTLWLQPQDSARRQVTRLGGARDSTLMHSYIGATDVDLDAIGAVSVGTTTSRDPLQPGVLFIERRAPPGSAPLTEITVRLGSEANRTDRTRFDGGYTALRVRQLSPAGFAGSWGSGVMREHSAGYFCATRVDGR
jgi:hypothetical protein